MAGHGCGGTRMRRDTCPHPTLKCFWKRMPKVLWHTFNSASSCYDSFCYSVFHSRAERVGQVTEMIDASSDTHTQTLHVAPQRRSNRICPLCLITVWKVVSGSVSCANQISCLRSVWSEACCYLISYSQQCHLVIIENKTWHTESSWWRKSAPNSDHLYIWDIQYLIFF